MKPLGSVQGESTIHWRNQLRTRRFPGRGSRAPPHGPSAAGVRWPRRRWTPASQKTSQPNRAHRIYPYLLRDREINRSNQVWCADITYLPMVRGFAYLVAINWHSRKVLNDTEFSASSMTLNNFLIQALHEVFNLDM